MTPERYQPTTRLVDDAERLRELYCERGLTIRQIADHPDCEMSKTRVAQALDEFSIERRNSPTNTECHGERGVDPPTVDWTTV
jgi:hypothetical protein